MKKKIGELAEKLEKILAGGGEEAIKKQRKKGKLLARERINKLLDKGSFQETDIFVTHRSKSLDMNKKELPGEGVVTGYGTISGKKICIFAQDFTVAGGSLGEMHAMKITKIMDLAMKMGIPLIGINDSGGARIQEGVNSLAGYGEIFYRNTRSSGVIPQISIILGPCAGGAVYSPALTDFIFVVSEISRMFITGPEVIKAVSGEETSFEELGGAKVHTKISGNAHFIASSEVECFKQVKKLLGYLPQNNKEELPRDKICQPPEVDFAKVVPPDSKKPYDVRKVISGIFDGGEMLEVQKEFAPNIVIGFSRLNGKVVGIVANQPMILAGVLDIDSSDKASRFVRFCDAFNVPIITFVDVPGYLPGVDQEYGGIIRHGAKLLYAYSEATVPKLTVIIRKAYGGAYIAMSSRHLGADFVYAWPTAEIAVMGPEGATNIIFKKEIAASSNPEKVRQEKIKEYRQKFTNPYVAASMGYVDEVIKPDQTRMTLAGALELTRTKKENVAYKKHGNFPV